MRRSSPRYIPLKLSTVCYGTVVHFEITQRYWKQRFHTRYCSPFEKKSCIGKVISYTMLLWWSFYLPFRLFGRNSAEQLGVHCFENYSKHHHPDIASLLLTANIVYHLVIVYIIWESKCFIHVMIYFIDAKLNASLFVLQIICFCFIHYYIVRYLSQNFRPLFWSVFITQMRYHFHFLISLIYVSNETDSTLIS